jgi:hypothetical protein
MRGVRWVSEDSDVPFIPHKPNASKADELHEGPSHTETTRWISELDKMIWETMCIHRRKANPGANHSLKRTEGTAGEEKMLRRLNASATRDTKMEIWRESASGNQVCLRGQPITQEAPSKNWHLQWNLFGFWKRFCLKRSVMLVQKSKDSDSEAWGRLDRLIPSPISAWYLVHNTTLFELPIVRRLMIFNGNITILP